MLFEDNKTYKPRDAELRILGPVATLAYWRSTRQGPAYFKVGRQVFYLGEDLNRFMQDHRVDPNDRPAAA